MAAEYSAICKQLELQIHLPEDKRTTRDVFEHWSAVFREMSFRSPLLPRWITRKLRKARRMQEYSTAIEFV